MLGKKKSSYFKSLQGKINLSLLLIVAIAVISFMLISLQQSKKVIRETSVEYTAQLLKMVNENIDSYIGNMENIAQIVTGDSDVSSYLFSEGTVDALFGTRVEQEFKTLMESRKDIYNIGIIGENHRYLINDKETVMNPYANLEGQEWYQMALAGGESLTSSHVQNVVQNEYPWVVTLSKGILGPKDSGKRGVLFVDLNYSSIRNLCENLNLGTKGYVFILDAQGNLIYHPKQQLIYSGFWEEEFDKVQEIKNGTVYSKDKQRMYTVTRSDVTGWSVVGVTDEKEMLASLEKIKVLYYLMAVALIGVAMMLSVTLMDVITKPLFNLRETMKRVENGELDVEIKEPDSADEIADLVQSFKRMLAEIRQLIDRNVREQREKRKSELNALQAQINPHFLYNTLDSIIWMAEDGNTKDVVLMTSSLARLLRRSISNKNEIVTLREEVEYTQSYLVIQKMRYKDKLEYAFDLDERVLGIEIVKLLIQPLVENAIYHGLKYKEDGKGMLAVSVAKEQDDIVIRVMDNGVGMTKEQLDHIFDERVIDHKRNGVGVLNVHRRIQLHYGPEYGLSFESQEGLGTTATIRIPYRTLGEV